MCHARQIGTGEMFTRTSRGCGSIVRVARKAEAGVYHVTPPGDPSHGEGDCNAGRGYGEVKHACQRCNPPFHGNGCFPHNAMGCVLRYRQPHSLWGKAVKTTPNSAITAHNTLMCIPRALPLVPDERQRESLRRAQGRDTPLTIHVGHNLRDALTRRNS